MTTISMGREAQASAEMRLLQVEAAVQQIGEQVRALVQQLNALAPRLQSLEAQTAAMIALHADDTRRLQTAVGLVQTMIYGTFAARVRWLIGI